jgi:hypothetical protein
VSINDAMRATNPPAQDELRAELRTALVQHRFAALVMDDPTVVTTINEMTAGGQRWQSYYNVQETLPGAAPGTRPDWLLMHVPPGEASSTP